MKARAPTAYFVFCNEFRQEEKTRLIQERGGDSKVAVGDVAKALGARWNAMSDAEKQTYKDKAQQADTIETCAKSPNNKDDGRDEVKQKQASSKAPDMLPLSVIKRIITSDPDISRVSHDALMLIAAAADQLLSLLAQRGMAAAKLHKRRTLKLEDFQHVVKHDRRLVETGLRDVVVLAQELQALSDTAAAEATAAQQPPSDENSAPDDTDQVVGEQPKGNAAKTAAKPAGAKKQKTNAPTGPRIDAFYQRQQTA